MSEYNENYQNALKEYSEWLNSNKIDDATRKELEEIKDNKDEILLRFSGYMSFGTAGLRSIMCAGTATMNIYTVAHATQGIAELILSEGGNAAERGVVIAWDSRINSELFARCAASVLAANNIKVYIFDSMRPTPVLSYAIRKLGCIAGINITASHNPKQYNGYKAYWEDGAQLPPDHADTAAKAIASAHIFNDVKTMNFGNAVANGLITVIGKDIDEPYTECVLEQAVDKNAIRKVSDSLKIVYTPLHGTGRVLIPQILSRLGLKNLYTVEQQMIPDGSFPTLKNPNPEFADAFVLGIKLAREVGSDLIVATDPDADRVGVMAKGDDGEFHTINGNQMGALLLDYIITAAKNSGTLADDSYAVKTIVTSELISKICEKNNVELFNVLTGFKFIGEVIKKHEAEGHGTYIFGLEESYGYLKGTYARDKDAVVASMLICEMAAYYKTKNMTLIDALNELYKKYGYYYESVTNLVMDGLDGLAKMAAFMDNMRKNPPKSIGGFRVVSIRDYDADTITNLDTGDVTSTGLPRSNVLYYQLECGDVVVIRPSGTEPKVKIYFLASGKDENEAKSRADAYKNSMQELTK